MPAPENNEALRERALLYAMGAMGEREREEFERLLATGNEEATAEVAAWQASLEAVVDGAPGVPGPGLKERLMGSIGKRRGDGFERFGETMEYLRQGRGKWHRTPFEGVTYQLLHLERETRMATSILRLEAGATYPPHHHSAMEQCLVLSGDVAIGGLRLLAGDYEKAFSGTDHEPMTTHTGCELLIISCLEDEIIPA